MFTSSRQLVEPLLCSVCEQKLGVYDEYVAELAYRRDGSCGLKSLVQYQPDTRAQVVDAPRLDAHKLFCFAVSVVWRAHVCQALPLSLGPYTNAIQTYLLTGGTVPRNVHVVTTWYDDSAQSVARRHLMECTIIPPQGNRADKNHLHWFLLCGLKFEVTVGSAPPSETVGHMCLGCADVPRIFVQDPYTSGMLESMREPMRKAKVRGKNARRVLTKRT